jgi:hypothetical protein
MPCFICSGLYQYYTNTGSMHSEECSGSYIEEKVTDPSPIKQAF